MGISTFPSSDRLVFRVNGVHLDDYVNVYGQPVDKPRGLSLRQESSPVLSKVHSGYLLKVLGEERDCYRVELYSGKVGYILKDKLIETGIYKHKEIYPIGSHASRSIKYSSQYIFAVDGTYKNGAAVFDQPDEKSRELFVLGPLEVAPIVETLDWHYKILLPGPTEGFVHRNLGVRRDWAPLATNNYGFYGVRKNKTNVVEVRYVPDACSEAIMDINTYFRVPIVEEWDNWFKVQLPDGSLGFVPGEFGNRTITADSLVDRPNDNSASVTSGLLKVAGLMVLGAIGGAVKESLRE